VTVPGGAAEYVAVPAANCARTAQDRSGPGLQDYALAIDRFAAGAGLKTQVLP
jgi:hypothetical protein